MTLAHFMGLLGGLALFLYGMQMMSSGLESVAGNKMKQILEKLTANRFLGVLVGAVITAVIQSSSATTVMVVGFVNSGMMTLQQAVWIIMGANIGTTITGQLIALDVGAIAPLIAFFGVAIVVFLKNEKLHHIGNILAGLGVLFIGMETTRQEITRMLGMAKENVENAFTVFAAKNAALLSEIEQKEEYVDYLNKEISKYITKAITHESLESGSQVFHSYFSMTSNIERISDHALNISDERLKIALIER